MTKTKTLFVTAIGIATLGLASACSVEALPTDDGTTEQALCENPEGIWSAGAALAASTAAELHRWQPLKDFSITYDSNGTGWLGLTSAGKALCADKKCAYTQAILDLQHAGSGNVKFNGTPFNGDNFRSTMTAKYQDQVVCESRPDGGNLANCPAELHTLTKKSTKAGSCDTVITFDAKTTSGGTLKEAAQLKNKLLWVGGTSNTYLTFTSTGTTVSIDPTAGLTEASTTSSGSCTAACTKVSLTNVATQCCVCNGATGKYAVSAFSPYIYLCK